MTKTPFRAAWLCAVLLISNLALAGEDESATRYWASVRRVKANHSHLDFKKGDIRNVAVEIKRLKAKTTPDKGQGSCDTCTSIAKEVCNQAREDREAPMCSGGGCEVSVLPADNICFRIYQNQRCYQEALTSASRSKVDSCFRVDDAIKLQAFQVEYKVLKREIKRLNEEGALLKGQHALLRKELALRGELDAIELDCQACAVAKSDDDHSSIKNTAADQAPNTPPPSAKGEGKIPIE